MPVGKNALPTSAANRHRARRATNPVREIRKGRSTNSPAPAAAKLSGDVVARMRGFISNASAAKRWVSEAPSVRAPAVGRSEGRARIRRDPALVRASGTRQDACTECEERKVSQHGQLLWGV